MERNLLVAVTLAAFIAAAALVLRTPPDGETRGVLKERIRAAESAVRSLEPERAERRASLRLARQSAETRRATARDAAAALPFYAGRTQRARAALNAFYQQEEPHDPPDPSDADALRRRMCALAR